MKIVLAKGGKSRATVKFGSVTVTADRVVKTELSRNVDLGRSAMRGVGGSLSKPGVKLPAKKTVPLFYVDPDNPKRVVRVLNGKRERGVFEDGLFKATE